MFYDREGEADREEGQPSKGSPVEEGDASGRNAWGNSPRAWDREKQ